MQYLIGEAPPSSCGMGESFRSAAATFFSVTGTQSYARLVHSDIFAPKVFSVGSGMKLIVPSKSPPMYSTVDGGVGFFGESGPCTFGFEITPLPFATSKVLPSEVTRTLVGYQPTGMKP